MELRLTYRRHLATLLVAVALAVSVLLLVAATIGGSSAAGPTDVPPVRPVPAGANPSPNVWAANDCTVLRGALGEQAPAGC